MTDAATDDPVWTIVVAGGGGTRFGGPKQFVEIAGRRVVDWSVSAARSASDGVVVVLPPADLDVEIPGADRIVAGGSTRAASVRAGLGAVPDAASIVLVHDAARPAVPAAVFARVVAAVRGGAVAVVPVVPVTDSLRHVDGAAVDRSTLVAVQTPQGFRARALRAAHDGGGDASDDATLVELTGATVVQVPGDPVNQKLTHPIDRAALDAALSPS